MCYQRKVFLDAENIFFGGDSRFWKCLLKDDVKDVANGDMI